MKMNKYDVIIAGGGTSGCACAYTLGKLGLKTLIIEKESFLGGSITSSLVVPAMKTSKNAINTDFFNTLYKELEKLDGAITYSDGNRGWFNPELTKIALDKLMKNAHVDILLESGINKINENLSGYIVTIGDYNHDFSKDELLPSIETNILVDATGDAKILEKLKDVIFLNDSTGLQPINLRFIMSGIDYKKFTKWLLKYDTNRDITSAADINGKIYMSTAYTWDSNVDWALKPLFKSGIEKGVITEEDSNYFQIFSIAGAPDSIGFNCPRILDTTLTRTEAYILGRESILRLSQFCKKYFKGFENAYISSIANTLGVRVSKRVKGKYIYTKEDLITGKKFENPVVISNYPIDVHSSKKGCSKLEKVYQEYQLPIESLIVKDNLFVIGRCLSAEFEAQAALRIIPSCFSMGEGVAKYIAKNVI